MKSEVGKYTCVYVFFNLTELSVSSLYKTFHLGKKPGAVLSLIGKAFLWLLAWWVQL